MTSDKKLGEHTKCRRCGKQDVDNTIDLRRVTDGYAALEIVWVCDPCFDTIRQQLRCGSNVES